ncbi:MAG TPA: SDR family NAD(P)-dependent oxidoreductase [Archangium sp.]|nr:SDR family NAD(P)-dependent oxidoreductase [Archangium sp.]
MSKVAVVTGAANGIGRVYAAHLCGEGARVLIADVDGRGAQTVADSLNESFGRPVAAPCQTDVTSESDTKRMAAAAMEHFGQLDILVNNAGTYPHVDFEDITFEAWRKVMSVNLDSVFLCTKAVLPIMKQQGGGKIINVATNLVWVGLPAMVHYITSKSGIVGFTRSLSRELGKYGITVNAIAPGAVIPNAEYSETSKRRVEMIVEQQCIKRPQKKEDLAGALLFLASPASDFISGQVLTVDGGLTNH